MNNASVEHPVYSKILQTDNKATKLFMIIVNEGWRESIMCTNMYEWAADWLLKVLQDRPKYAPNTRES